MTLRRFTIVLLLLLTFLSVRSQSWYGYSYATGVDGDKWITLTDPDTIKSFNQNSLYSPLVELDFPFGFLGSYIHSLSVSWTGVIVCNTIYDYRIPATILPILSENYSNPIICMYGNTDQLRIMAVCQTVGTPGERTFVCEVTQRLAYDTSQVCNYQLQLDESTCSFRFVYGTATSGAQSSGQIGFTGARYRFINIAPDYHVASTDNISSSASWPGNYRFYQFTPSCANVINLAVSNVGYNSARITWSPLSNDSCYKIHYSIHGGVHSELTTQDTSIVLRGLQSCSLYDVQVFTVCRGGQIGGDAPIQFRTVARSCSNIPFTMLWDDFVECRIGDFAHPDNKIEVVDSGYRSNKSRHTVHCNSAERDSITQYQLRTVPVGHCSSVRLGNSWYGAEQESITYTLHVDTNNYDLLLLRYAIVEQNPEHLQPAQPHVLFTIYDSAGAILGSCYRADFISGALSGWVDAIPQSGAVWRDWDIYGINLTDFHGQTIRVSISNFDCSQGAHWGYVYFTLEGVSKQLTTTVCGANTENTFYAPKGFNYRWYSADNPIVTLATVDSLHVTSPGLYYCYVYYQLAGSSCGFTLSARAGERYPVARFSNTMVDGCGAVRYFDNQSVVAYDAAHTQLTNEPCERYLWRFSDGTTDSAINITRTFGNGTYTVTLIAMLANGACVDSVSQTFTVNIPTDTTYASACTGEPYQFGNMSITEDGQYSYVDNCVEHILIFTTLTSPPTLLIDTICMGDTLFWGDMSYFNEGNYSQVFVNQYGCDSLVNLQLSCYPRYSHELRDTIPLGDRYPVGDTSFAAPGQYTCRLLSIYGCDSVLDIRLSCITNYDTTICVSSLPFLWDTMLFEEAGQRSFSYTSQAGTDSIIAYTLHVREFAQPQITLDQSCDSDIYYIVELGGGYHYTWLVDSTNNDIVTVVEDSLYYIHATDSTYYYILAEYPDTPFCPAKDSILVDTAGLHFIIVDFSISPETVTSETSSITLTDKSQYILNREWYVNGQLWPETGNTTTVDISLVDDMIEICLVGYRRFCHLSICKKVAVEWRSIYFPNVFTPDRESNNHFAPVGIGIADFEMWIYDRRGALMFHTTDMQKGWDGTSRNIKCRQEVYAYTCRYRIKEERGYQTHTGTVLLLR